MKFLIGTFFILLLSSGGILWKIHSEKQDDAEEPIIIGAIFPLTGPIALFGEPALRAAQEAVVHINNAGGINGRPIELVFQDDQGTPSGAIDALNQITSRTQTGLFIQFAGATIAATAPLVGDSGVIVSPSIRTDNLMSGYPHVFTLGQSVEEEMRVLSSYMSQHNIESAAIIYQSNDFGETYKNALVQEFNGTVIPYGEQLTEIDFRTTITKIKSNAARAIVVTMNPPQALSFLKQVREMGLDDTLIFMNWLAESPALFESGSLVQGLLFTSPILLSDDPEKTAVYDKLTRNGIPLHALSLNSYDAVLLYANALSACDEYDNVCIQTFIRTASLDGIGGSIQFNETENPERPVYLKTIHDSTIIPVLMD